MRRILKAGGSEDFRACERAFVEEGGVRTHDSRVCGISLSADAARILVPRFTETHGPQKGLA
jgi:hypothetical protein